MGGSSRPRRSPGGVEGSAEVRAMAAAFSVQLDPGAWGRGPAGAFLGYNEAALNGSGQLRERRERVATVKLTNE